MNKVLSFILIIISLFPCSTASAATPEQQAAAMLQDSRMERFAVPLDGKIKQGTKIGIISSKGITITEARQNTACTVIGECENEYYIAANTGFSGYVPKSKVTVTGPREIKSAGTADWIVTVDHMEIPFLMIFGSSVSSFSGEIRSSLPLTEIRVELYSFRQMKEECGIYIQHRPEEGVLSFDLASISKMIPFSKLRPGDHYLTVTVSSGNLQKVLYNSVFCVSGNMSRQYSAVGSCKYSITDANLKSLTDGSCLTGWKMGGSKSLIITFDQGKVMDSIQLEFLDIRHDITVRYYDKSGNVLETCRNGNPGSFYITDYAVPNGAAKAEIMCDRNATLTEIYVYEKGKKSIVAQHWEEVPEKVDVMVISAHRNDECLFFGGVIPWCVTQGKTVALVYMTDPCLGRPAYTETLNALWALGLRTYPLYLHMVDERNTWERTIADWGGYENMYGAVTEVIRKYKPDVVIGHDLNGEFGHFNHILTADSTLHGVLYSGDETMYTESAEKYGVWDVPKYYIHLYDPEHRINVDFNTPVESLMNLSPLQTAYVAFEKHSTEAHHSSVYSLDSFGKDYDNTCFGLYRTLVGPDTENNDFFEHIEKAGAER